MTQDKIDAVTALYHGKPDFWARYLGEGRPKNLTMAEAGLLHDNGIKILPIEFNYDNGDTVGSAAGTRIGQQAVDDAKQFQIPPGVAIFVDLEPYSPSGGANCCANYDSAFVQAWYDTVKAGGYTPGYYGTPRRESAKGPNGENFRSAFCGAVSAEPEIGDKALLWSFTPNRDVDQDKPGPATFAPDTMECGGQTVLWQYNNFNSGQDEDVALSTVPLW